MGSRRGTYGDKGQGSIVELVRGKKYKIRVVVSPPGEEPVRQRQETFHGNKTAALARRDELRREAATLRGLLPDERSSLEAQSKRTVSDLMDAYLVHLSSPAPTKSPRTVQAAKDADRLYIRPTLGPVKLKALTAEMIDTAIAGWFEGSRSRKLLAPSSVRRIVAVLSSALSQAVKWRWISSNPARDAATPSGKRTREIFIPSFDDMTALIKQAEAIGDETMAAAIAVAFLTGVRRGELAALRWGDIDLASGIATISRNLVRDGSGWVEKGTKTDKVRSVPLPQRAVLFLRALPGDHEGNDRVIDVPNPDVLTDRFRKICIGAGYVNDEGKPLFRLNDERHAHTTQLIAAGVDIATVAALSGRNVRTTADIYTHALPAGAETAREALERLSD